MVTAGEPSDNLKLEDSDSTLVSAETVVLTMAEAEQDYMIWALVENTVTHEFSIARVDEAASKV